MCGRELPGLNQAQVEALQHPIRLRIVELCAPAPARPPSVSELAEGLGEGFEGVSLSRVNYHLRHLQQVRLIPTRGRD